MATAQGTYTMRPVIPENRADYCGRITIGNIPQGISETQLIRNLKHYGDAKVHLFVPGCEYSSGWAWVSFPSKEDVAKLLQTSSEMKLKRELLADSADSEKLCTPTCASSFFGERKTSVDIMQDHEDDGGPTSEGEAIGDSEQHLSQSASSEQSDTDAS